MLKSLLLQPFLFLISRHGFHLSESWTSEGADGEWARFYPHGIYVIPWVTLGGKSGTGNLCRLQTHGDPWRQGENAKINSRGKQRYLWVQLPLSKDCAWAQSLLFFLGDINPDFYTSLHENASLLCGLQSTNFHFYFRLKRFAICPHSIISTAL